jgi:integrase
MGHINKTPAGNFRANWRDPAGKQRAKTFPTRKLAAAFLAEVESTKTQGAYIDPKGSKTKFGSYAATWLAARNNEKTSAARDASYMRTHVLPQWSAFPVGAVTFSMVQAWITDLSSRLAPASVIKCHQLASAVFTAAIRDRLISANPCDGVKLPSLRRADTDLEHVIPLTVLRDRLLPVVPAQYQALVAAAAGAGLRWGECIGLCLDAIDLDAQTVSVTRTVIEISGSNSLKPYPKSRAGRRTIPLPGFAALALKVHIENYPRGPHGEIFTSPTGGPLYRGTFRTYTWRPALVRAGLLGSITRQDDGRYLATWTDASGLSHTGIADNEPKAITMIARNAGPSLRFHDLRHSYATWLVSRGVPINDIARVLGHGQITTTLNRYTHVLPNPDERVRGAFDDFPLTPPED